MPGRTPHDAVLAFLDPLKEALRVLDGVATVTTTPKGGYRKNVVYVWNINGGDGMKLGKAGTFFASMQFEIIDADQTRHDAPYRVTTRAYNYKLEGPDGEDLWRMHWHPDGNSHEVKPHLHIHPNLDQHQASPRMSFEKAIRWCIACRAPTRCSKQEAMARLELIEAPHILYRSWADYPDEPRS